MYVGIFSLSAAALEQPHHSHSSAITTISTTTAADISTISHWEYPGAHMLTLPALCVEVNGRLRPGMGWVMPVTIAEILDRLGSVGIHSAAQLAVRLCSDTGVHLFGEGGGAALPSGGVLDAHALFVFKELMQVSPAVTSSSTSHRY
jgi:hypothetical protein